MLDDGTQVSDYGDPSEYYENIIPPAGWFYTYKEFYGNGNIKQSGKLFRKGEFKSGVWSEYDSAGNVVKTIDYDAPYKMKVEAVIDILHKNGVVFALANKFDAIDREIQESRPVWVAEWKSRTKENWVDRVVIDDASGRIIVRTGFGFKKN